MRTKSLKTLMLCAIMFALCDVNHAQAQYDLDYGLAFGTGHYLGDVGGKAATRQDFFYDLHFNSSRFSSHAFVRYRLNKYITLRGQIGTTMIGEDDAKSVALGRAMRNVHFRNFVNELSARGEFHFYTNPHIFSKVGKFHLGLQAYALAGLTGFSHAPQAKLDRDAAEFHFLSGRITTEPNLFDYDRWYDLRSEQTEIDTYGKLGLALPLGLGTMVTINNDIRVGLEFVWNLTTSDFLDDVSRTYNNPALMSDLGIVLSCPASAELYAQLHGSPRDGDDTYATIDGPWGYRTPSEGVPERIRGNPDKNDTYGSLQLTVAKVIQTQSNFSQKNFTSSRLYRVRPQSRRPQLTRTKY